MCLCVVQRKQLHWALQAAALRTHCHARLKQFYRLKRRAGKRITLTSAAIMSRLACSQPAAGEENSTPRRGC